MAATILPQDGTEHLEAAIQLSNRRVHLRFLDEAEELLALNFPAAAVLVGVALEAILAGQREEVITERRQRMEMWSELRNSAARAPGDVSPDRAAEMVVDVRRLLTLENRLGPSLGSSMKSAAAPRQVRRKYTFVPTSSADFIRRKADELRLEHNERGN